MKRIGFKMRLNKGRQEEYKRRHDEIWPDLKKIIQDSGVYDYTIYLDEDTLTLYGSFKLRDHNSYNDLPLHPLMKKWWDYMKDIMETNPDNSPVSTPLREMFYME